MDIEKLIEAVSDVLEKEKDWTPQKYAAVHELLGNMSSFSIVPMWVATNHGSFELVLSVSKK